MQLEIMRAFVIWPWDSHAEKRKIEREGVRIRKQLAGSPSSVQDKVARSIF